MSTTDAAVQKNIFGSCMTTLIISNEEIDVVMKIVKSLKEFRLLIKGVTKTIKKEQKDGFLGMLLGTLGASLLGSMLPGKGAIAARAGIRTIRAGEDIIRAYLKF